MRDFLTALVNPKMPRTFGDSAVHHSLIDTFVPATSSTSIGILTTSKPSKAEEKIGQLIAERLVDDGATLQLGRRRTGATVREKPSLIKSLRYWQYSGFGSEPFARS